MSVWMAKRTEPESVWAERVARELLEPLEERWRHTQRVVNRGRAFRDMLTADELDVLIDAAYLHDVGYPPKLAATGFHPLDGAPSSLKRTRSSPGR
jgi:hypothetical protein